VKVPTTPHDLTVAIVECIQTGARDLGLEVRELLRETTAIRLSTTIGTNAVIERSGPRLGVLVTSGFERSLYDPAGAEGILDVLVPREMVMGITEEVGEDGGVSEEPDERQVAEVVRALMERSARMIVVALRNADRNPANERRVKALIQAGHPDRFIRYLPVQLGTEVSPFPGDYERVATAILNAYIHREMARTLYRTEDKLRDAGMKVPLLIVHSTGGVHRVAKTVAVQTLNSGPAAALHGAQQWARAYGLPRVVTMDMGGTSVDVGAVEQGQLPYGMGFTFRDIPLSLPTVAVSSIGAGGGSVAALDASGALTVGPRSAGWVPGPACCDRGGTEPTVTDADLLLGYIDPDHFLGGKFRLKRDRATTAIRERLARPLGQPVEPVAAEIRGRVQQSIADHIRARLGPLLEPAILMAFGGAGPLHACGVAEQLGIRRVVVFPYGAVFSAFGATTLERAHVYMGRLFRPLNDPAGMAPEIDRAAEELRQAALRDLTNEEASITLRLELVVDAKHTGRRLVEVGAPPLGSGDLLARRLAAAGVASDSASLVGVILRASLPAPSLFPPPPLLAHGQSREWAPRLVFWGLERCLTPVYSSERLEPGSRVEGPALIEAGDWVCAVGPGWSYTVDDHRNGVLEHQPSARRMMSHDP
jgi:N-methylhydantoinase A/acetophenone carboxylase